MTQFAYSHASRFAFGPKGLWNNLLGEWRRYEPLLGQPGVGSWLVVIGIWPALAYLVYCLLYDDNRGYRILAVTLVVTALVLALLETTKVPVYALALLPSICLVLALGLGALLTWKAPGRAALKWLVRMAVVMLLAIVVAGAARAYQRDYRASFTVSSYQVIGDQMLSTLPAGASIIGPERWWWPFRNQSYRSLNNIWLQWEIARDRSQANAPTFAQLVTESNVQAIIVNDNVHGEVTLYPKALQDQFWSYLRTCTRQMTSISDPTYGKIDLYVVKPLC